MRIEPRILGQDLGNDTPETTKMLLLFSEIEGESKTIDEILGNKDFPIFIEGKVDLAEGYGEHYISLQAKKFSPKFSVGDIVQTPHSTREIFEVDEDTQKLRLLNGVWVSFESVTKHWKLQE